MESKKIISYLKAQPEGFICCLKSHGECYYYIVSKKGEYLKRFTLDDISYTVHLCGVSKSIENVVENIIRENGDIEDACFLEKHDYSQLQFLIAELILNLDFGIETSNSEDKRKIIYNKIKNLFLN